MYDRRGKSALFTPRAAGALILIALVGFLAGCGGTKTANTTVAQVQVSPNSASLVAGQVLIISASAVNSANVGVATTFTFHSSNTGVATVSPSGAVCGGVWDSLFVVCNGTDALGNPITGSAIITVTAGNVTSGPINVSVHPSVTAVSVDPLPGGACLSTSQTHQFTAHAFHNGTEITGSVGNFSWSTSDSSVATVDTNGLSTAKNGGLAGIVASIGGTTSPAVPLKTCMPAFIVLHIAGDPAGNFTTSATMNTTDTKSLQADVIDERGVVQPAAPITFLSNNALVASVSGATLTANTPGGAGIQAVCAPPTCGNGLNTPIYSNLFSVTVNGTSPNTTTVYAASSFPVPTGQIMPLLPIDVSKSPPVAGAAIPLPGVPNSIVFDRTGARAFIGTNVGLAALDAGSNTVTLVAPTTLGKVLAISPDGNKVILSNAAIDPATGLAIEQDTTKQRVFIFDRGVNPSTITTFVAAGAIAATYDDDSFRAYIIGNNGNYYVFSPVQTFLTAALGGTGTDAATLASGPFAYAATATTGIKVIATCNNALQASPPTNGSAIQLIGAVKNANQIFAVDGTGVDIITASVAPFTPPTPITAATCAPGVSYSNQFVDFGVGPITANQLLVGSNGTRAAVLAAGIPKVFDIVPGGFVTINLAAGGTEPLSGGITPDGNTAWVGVAGTNTVDMIDLGSGGDKIQVPTTFKKADGSPAPPNLVTIRPK